MRLAVVCSFLLINVASACADESVDVNDVFGRFGFKSTPVASDGACKVSMELTQAEFVSKIPELQRLGLLNDEMSTEKISSMPNALSMTFLIQMASATTNTFYKNNAKADSCSFSAYVVARDEYGHDVKNTAFYYNFDRKTYGRINWEHFEDKNILKVASGFKFTPSFMEKVQSEMSDR